MQQRVLRYESLEDMSVQAARYVVRSVCDDVSLKGWSSLVLSGGTTPRLMYELLAGPGFADDMPWENLFVFWADERCVPADHPQSNYRMAQESLLSKISIPPENIHRVHGEMLPARAAARQYERAICDFLGSRQPGDAARTAGFDLILLGMGLDGHTASLFSGGAELEETEALVTVSRAPDTYEIRDRITMTLPFINRALNAAFLLSGRDKLAVAGKILGGPRALVPDFPAAHIVPRRKLTWFVDEGGPIGRGSDS